MFSWGILPITGLYEQLRIWELAGVWGRHEERGKNGALLEILRASYLNIEIKPLGNFYTFSSTRIYLFKYFNVLQALGSYQSLLLRSCNTCFLATQRKGLAQSNLAIR